MYRGHPRSGTSPVHSPGGEAPRVQSREEGMSKFQGIRSVRDSQSVRQGPVRVHAARTRTQRAHARGWRYPRTEAISPALARRAWMGARARRRTGGPSKWLSYEWREDSQFDLEASPGTAGTVFSFLARPRARADARSTASSTVVMNFVNRTPRAQRGAHRRRGSHAAVRSRSGHSGARTAAY